MVPAADQFLYRESPDPAAGFSRTDRLVTHLIRDETLFLAMKNAPTIAANEDCRISAPYPGSTYIYTLSPPVKHPFVKYENPSHFSTVPPSKRPMHPDHDGNGPEEQL